MEKTSIYEEFDAEDVQILSKALDRMAGAFTEFEYYTTAASMGFKRSPEIFNQFLADTVPEGIHYSGGRSYSKETINLYLKLILLRGILST